MAWVRIDDQAPRNTKMLKAGPAACWLWVCGIAHCQSQLTDGFISLDVLPMIGIAGAPRAIRLADSLVKAGLFEKADGGYQVHDYLDFNPSRATVLRKRAEDAARKRAAESCGTPDGIQSDSRAPRAGVPSHPIPSEPNRGRPRARMGGGVLAGSYPKDHLGHAVCGRVCLLDRQFAEFVRRFGGDAALSEKAVRTWAEGVLDEWDRPPKANESIGGSTFAWWSARWDEWRPAAPKPAVARPNEPASNVPSADKTAEYLRKQREAH